MAIKLGYENAVVIDASVCIKWFVREDGSDAAIRLVEEGMPFLAPDLLFAEFANVMWLKHRAGALNGDQIDRAMEEFGTYFSIFDVTPSWELMWPALSLAQAFDHPVYDCLYLALAEREKLPLVTADRRFHALVQAKRPTAPIQLIA